MAIAALMIGCFLAGFVGAAILIGPIIGIFCFKGAASEAASICG